MELLPPQGMWPPRLRHEASTAAFCRGSHQARGPSSATMRCRRKGWSEPAPAVHRWLQMAPTPTKASRVSRSQIAQPCTPRGAWNTSRTGAMPCTCVPDDNAARTALYPSVSAPKPGKPRNQACQGPAVLEHRATTSHPGCAEASSVLLWNSLREDSVHSYGMNRHRKCCGIGNYPPAFNPFKEPAKKEKLNN